MGTTAKPFPITIGRGSREEEAGGKGRHAGYLGLERNRVRSTRSSRGMGSMEVLDESGWKMAAERKGGCQQEGGVKKATRCPVVEAKR